MTRSFEEIFEEIVEGSKIAITAQQEVGYSKYLDYKWQSEKEGIPLEECLPFWDRWPVKVPALSQQY